LSLRNTTIRSHGTRAQKRVPFKPSICCLHPWLGGMGPMCATSTALIANQVTMEMEQKKIRKQTWMLISFLQTSWKMYEAVQVRQARRTQLPLPCHLHQSQIWN
jgi:hypothetical protein